MTKDQERKVAAKQLLCTRYTSKMMRWGLGKSQRFLFTCGAVLAAQ